MILASLDFETTGLDKQKDHIIEVGLVLYSTGQNRILESTGFLVDSSGVPITSEITSKTGITQIAVDTFGYSQESAVQAVLEYIDKADAIIGHNINWFDLPILHNTIDRLKFDRLPEKLIIDTMTDIPGVKGEKLVTMCADKGFVFDAHGAEADARAVIKLTSIYNRESPDTSYEKMVERAKSPLMVILSGQDNTQENNKIARKAGFRWNPEFKIWWQAVKEMDVEKLAQSYQFKMSYAPKEIPLEHLRDN